MLKKSFWGDARKFLEPLIGFTCGEGPHRLIQNRSQASVMSLTSGAAAGKPRDRLSRDFWRCWIFDFFNNICQEETHASQQVISLYERTCRRNIKKRIQRQDWQKKSAVGLRAATAFLYAPTRPRLSPHGGRNSQRARQLSTPSTR